MADSAFTVGALRRKTVITDEEVDAAVDAYLADPNAEPYGFKSGYVVDVRAAVDAHRPSHAALSVPGISHMFRRSLIRTAVILTVPVIG